MSRAQGWISLARLYIVFVCVSVCVFRFLFGWGQKKSHGHFHSFNFFFFRFLISFIYLLSFFPRFCFIHLISSFWLKIKIFLLFSCGSFRPAEPGCRDRYKSCIISTLGWCYRLSISFLPSFFFLVFSMHMHIGIDLRFFSECAMGANQKSDDRLLLGCRRTQPRRSRLNGSRFACLIISHPVVVVVFPLPHKMLLRLNWFNILIFFYVTRWCFVIRFFARRPSLSPLFQSIIQVTPRRLR